MPPLQLRGPRQIGRAERWTPVSAKGFKYWIAVVGVVLVGFTATMLWGWTAGLVAVVAGVWLQEKLVLAPVDEDLPAQASPHEEDSPTRKGVAWWGGAGLLVLLLTYLAIGIRRTVVHPPDHFWGLRPPADGEPESVVATVLWVGLVCWLSWRLWRHLRTSA